MKSIYAVALVVFLGCHKPEKTNQPTAQPVGGNISNAQSTQNLLGSSKETAIEVCYPAGQQAYLYRLRCSDGAAPTFSRRGNVGMRSPTNGASEQELFAQMDANRPIPEGQLDYHVIDVYEVACANEIHEIYMDMYHCSAEPPSTAPQGFTIQ